MAVPKALPSPARNVSGAGVHSLISTIVGADLIVAVGDYTGGAEEDLFTLSSHGLKTGDTVHVLWQDAMGVVTGGEATRALVLVLSSSTFQLTTNGTTIIENSADGTVILLKGQVPTPVVELAVIPNLIVDDWDYTGGTVEDQGTPAQGMKGIVEGDRLKLLYKSAAGVTAGTVNTTYYAKAPTTTYHQISATNGGNVIDSTADGTAVFLKIS